MTLFTNIRKCYSNPWSRTRSMVAHPSPRKAQKVNLPPLPAPFMLENLTFFADNSFKQIWVAQDGASCRSHLTYSHMRVFSLMQSLLSPPHPAPPLPSSLVFFITLKHKPTSQGLSINNSEIIRPTPADHRFRIPGYCAC